MKLTNKERNSYDLDKHVYVIKYVTPYGSGQIIIKKSLWENYQKKFTKVMKDAVITSLEERCI